MIKASVLRFAAPLSAAVFALVAGHSVLSAQSLRSGQSVSPSVQTAHALHVASATARPDQADSIHSYPC